MGRLRRFAIARSTLRRIYELRTGHNVGRIGLLGTRRGFRKIEFGQAMLLADLYVLKATSLMTAERGVDAENPIGALRLRQSVDFHKAFTHISFYKTIDDGVIP